MQLKSFLNHTFFLLVLSCSMGCASEQELQVPEKGISKELAEFRTSQLSNVSYDLNFNIPIDKSEAIQASLLLSFDLKGKDDVTLDFNASRENLSKITINGKESEIRHENEHIILDASLLKEESNKVRISFVAGDMSLNRNQEFLYTLFVPDRASTAFPCFDQPNMKGRFKTTLQLPKDWTAISNGPLENESAAEDRKTLEFGFSKPISTYLYAFAAGKFEMESREKEGRVMNFLHRETDKELVKRNLDQIFDLHYSALQWLEEYTGIEYPFQKFDFVAIPPFQYGGMEHVGAIQYRQSALFLAEGASEVNELSRASLIAHETAHMWFGNLVTMDWFNDVWMKEVFANFMAAKIANPNFPEIDHDLRFFLAHHPRAMEVDRSLGSNPIRQELDNLKNAGSLYGAIIYQKAPIVMRQLESLIGKEAFRSGIQSYLDKHAFGNATWTDLIEILDTKSDKDLRAWSKVWVNKPGMPTISYSSEGMFQEPRFVDQVDQWPQQVSFAPFAVDEFETVSLNSDSLKKEFNDDVMLNVDGVSYGFFLLNRKQIATWERGYSQTSSPLRKVVIMQALYENMLEGIVSPKEFLSFIIAAIEGEDIGQQQLQFYSQLANAVSWKFLAGQERQDCNTRLAEAYKRILMGSNDAAKKKLALKALQGIANDMETLGFLENIWNGSIELSGVQLSEPERISLLLGLVLKGGSQELLSQQREQIENPDRKKRFDFVAQALSPNQDERIAFFRTLSVAEKRSNEPWVLEAMRILCHPVREEEAIAFIGPGLELLSEIQLTGDIFFPKRWLDALLSGHQSKKADELVKDYLLKNEGLEAALRLKVLQSSDLLKRSAGFKEN